MSPFLRSAYTLRHTKKNIRVSASKGKPAYSYVRKAKTYSVKSRPAPDVGTLGQKKSVIGTLKGGMLTRYGYHPVEARPARLRSLAKSIKVGREAPLSVFRRLIAIGTLTKRTLPTASKIYRNDAKWIKNKYMSITK